MPGLFKGLAIMDGTTLGPEPRISPGRLQLARLRLARISGGDNPRKKVQSLVRRSTAGFGVLLIFGRSRERCRQSLQHANAISATVTAQ
jgi:hypothetical protein